MPVEVARDRLLQQRPFCVLRVACTLPELTADNLSYVGLRPVLGEIDSRSHLAPRSENGLRDLNSDPTLSQNARKVDAVISQQIPSHA